VAVQVVSEGKHGVLRLIERHIHLVPAAASAAPLAPVALAPVDWSTWG